MQIINAPPQHSTSNGQVKRFHSTLSEIVRCLKLQQNTIDTTELILKASIEYNRTIHSITSRRPIDVIHSSPEELKRDIKNKIVKAQERLLETHNKNRQSKNFKVGDKVFIKINKRLGNKLSPLYEEGIVEADIGTMTPIKVY